MKKPGLYILTGFLFISHFSIGQRVHDIPVIDLVIDGAVKNQLLDGIGVNVNTRSWNGKELEPALLLLLDTMKAGIWRVVVETVEKWEETNDNSDPFSFNWHYYDSLYETPKFQKAWGMMAFLNQHGITKNLMINFMGYVPKWMGEETVKPGWEDEYVEMIVSFFYYARNKKHLQFGLVSPTNESDWRSEGPKLDPVHYALLMKKLMQRMESLGMGDILYVGPDTADMNKAINDYIPLLMNDPFIMTKMADIGVHSYGGYYAPIDSALKHSPYPQSGYWVTEWNKWQDGLDEGVQGIYNYDFAAGCINHMIDLLQHGARALLVWEGYDSYYEHHAPSPFSYWGILAYDHQHKTYSPRKHLYAISQFSAFVAPGARQVGHPFTNDSIRIVTFFAASSHTVTITGINRRRSGITLNATLTHLPVTGNFKLYYTNSSVNIKKGNGISTKKGRLKARIPADCIFTLTNR